MGEIWSEDCDSSYDLSSDQELLAYLFSMHPWSFGNIGKSANVISVAIGNSVTGPGSTSAGSFMVAVGMPYPHPDRDFVVYQIELIGGFFRLTCTIDGRLLAEVIEVSPDGQRSIMSVLSCAIVYPDERVSLKAGAAWAAPDDMTLCVNGIVAASTKAETKVASEITIRAVDRSVVPKNYSHDSAAAKIARKGTVAGTRPRDPHRVPRTLDRDLLDLRREITQIRDLLGLVRAGRAEHALGIASRVRKLLVGTRGNMGLLQRCAGRLDAPITVYTTAQPDNTDKFEPTPSLSLNVEINGVPYGDFTNPIDVDVWLKQTGGSIDGKALKHLEIISAIGNSEASHGDPETHPVVGMLEIMGTAISGHEVQEFLVYYVCRVGESIADSAERLLISPKEN